MRIFCNPCGEEMEYIGISKDKMHCYECPKCGEREFYKDKNVKFEFSDKDYQPRSNPKYPLGSQMSKYTTNKIINRD